MMQASVYGRIGQEPKSVDTRSGKLMAVSSMAVDVGSDEDIPLWVGLVAFGPMAEELLRHDKGDLVSAAGRVQRKSWTDRRTGEKREQLQIVADSLISSRSVRPRNGSRKPRQSKDQNRAGEANDSSLPF